MAIPSNVDVTHDRNLKRERKEEDTREELTKIERGGERGRQRERKGKIKKKP